MRWMVAVAQGVFSLFVDDGRFALAIMLCVLAVALGLPLVPLPAVWHGPVLFAGLALVLGWSCLHRIGHC